MHDYLDPWLVWMTQMVTVGPLLSVWLLPFVLEMVCERLVWMTQMVTMGPLLSVWLLPFLLEMSVMVVCLT